MSKLKRREFIKFMAHSSASLSAAPFIAPFFTGCSSVQKQSHKGLPFSPINPVSKDEFVLSSSFNYEVLISYGDKINSKEIFGFNNDFIATIPLSQTEAYLWVNHESIDPLTAFAMDYKDYFKNRDKKQVLEEMKLVGGTLLKIKKNSKGKWKVDLNSNDNKRFDATTMMTFNNNKKIMGRNKVMGTLANCAGGQTPWGSFLTCEENYQNFYIDKSLNNMNPGKVPEHHLQWGEHYKNPSELYGWVVEINPKTKQAKKLVGLGRFSHECATVVQLKDKRCVVYSGDDQNDGCLYKFVADKPNSLDSGELFVANLEKGQWISLDIEKNKSLKAKFKSQTDVLINARYAARIAGGSLLDRPEDIEVSPVTGDVFVALTNNKPKNNYHGSILKLSENDRNYESMTFQSETFLDGGGEFSCPDNFVFDKQGNLWMTNDISGSKLNKGNYQKFGNNGLYYIPLIGENAGNVYQVASAPMTAELTGPCFAPDGKTLFLSVQHPGEDSESLKTLKSHWPGGGKSMPKPSVVAIDIPFLA